MKTETRDGASRKQQDAMVARELGKAGIQVASVFDLVNSGEPYPTAIGPLLEVMDSVEDPWILEGVVRALSVKEARGVAGPALFGLFRRLGNSSEGADRSQSLKWAVGNALAMTATEADCAEMVELFSDRRHGQSRQMLAFGLGRLRSQDAEEALVRALGDEDVVAHALRALGERRASSALAAIEPLTRHPDKLIRKEALRALKRIAGRKGSR